MTQPPLQLPGHIHVAPTADELYDDLGLVLMANAIEAVKSRGVFHVALSGGSTPEPFYMRLVTDPRFRAVPWQQTHIWMVDERRVPESDPKSNYKMIRETLVDHITIRKRQVHPVMTMAEDPAAAYVEELSSEFRVPSSEFESDASSQLETRNSKPETISKIPRLDFILLGMGDDAHTASLFPGSRALAERRRWVVNNDGPRVTPPARVTMTYPLLNAGRRLAVLLTGAKKSAVLRRVEEQLRTGGPNPELMPITGIQPEAGELTWYLDAAAAGQA